MTPAPGAEGTTSRWRRVVLRGVLVLLGLAGGFWAGVAMMGDLPPAVARRVDLLPPPWQWGPVYGLVAVSWLAAFAVMLFSRRGRMVALGWWLGVPVIPVIALVYNWLTWGQFGTTPTIP